LIENSSPTQEVLASLRFIAAVSNVRTKGTDCYGSIGINIPSKPYFYGHFPLAKD